MNNIRKIVRKVISESFEADNNKTYIPPMSAKQTAERARNYIKNNSKKVNSIDNPNEGSGAESVENLIRRAPLTHSQMKRYGSFFKNNAEKVKSERDQNKTYENSNILLVWDLHGGDSFKTFVEQNIERTKQENLDTKKNLRRVGGAGGDSSVFGDGSGKKGTGIFNTKLMSTPSSLITNL